MASAVFSSLGSGLDWTILKRWDVPWQWKTVSLISLACISSFVLTGLVEKAALPYLGIKFAELSLHAKAGMLFVSQGIVTAVVLGVLFGIIRKLGSLPEDASRYDLKNPFGLLKGWLLWAAVGLIGALSALVLTGHIVHTFRGEIPKRKNDAVFCLVPFIGISRVSTLWVIGIAVVLAPLLEDTVFRGFFMVAMTKKVPTPAAVLISAAAFAFSHQTAEVYPQLIIIGVFLGFKYATTRNLSSNYYACLLERSISLSHPLA